MKFHFRVRFFLNEANNLLLLRDKTRYEEYKDLFYFYEVYYDIILLIN